MNDQQLLRYSRQIMLPGIDIEGQQRLLQSHVLIIGAGGLGSPVAMYLAASGVGQITITDDDQVDLSNLQRQILHHQQDIGRDKVDSAVDTLKGINPDIKINTIAHRLNAEELEVIMQQVDAVVDASDNFNTRFTINAACVRQQIPLISGAAIRMEGQISVFTPGKDNSPCYHCLYTEGDELEQTCSENGVLSPLVGIIGSMQALETLKVLLDLGQTLAGQLMILDALHMEWRSIKLRRDPDCPVCSREYSKT
ncbi:MAG: molybdopterin-synthase adenylyltransferase MoeB [Gammaproteobacteria bacterium]|nr:molybdopterin-synthase adenylyltransferase MoeB [Gammaproteobacteria bacterium]